MHGDCLVPQKCPGQQKLANWVNKVRMTRQSLSATQLRALAAVGFVWAKSRGRQAWDYRYKQLQAYHASHGHSNVPTRYLVRVQMCPETEVAMVSPWIHMSLYTNQENPRLGRWASTQRAMYKPYTMEKTQP
jgi:Helicase associated domain